MRRWRSNMRGRGSRWCSKMRSGGRNGRGRNVGSGGRTAANMPLLSFCGGQERGGYQSKPCNCANHIRSHDVELHMTHAPDPITPAVDEGFSSHSGRKEFPSSIALYASSKRTR